MAITALRFESQQRQAATPRLQQAVRLLQLSSQEFCRELMAMAATNPFLDVDEPDDEVDSPLAEPADAWLYSCIPDRAMSGQGTSDTGALDFAPARTDLRALLTAQLGTMRLSPRDLCLSRTVIESLDDDGYLRTSLDELATLTAMQPAPSACEMGTALSHVQSLEPAGVGARDLAECLLLQLHQLASPESQEALLACEIVQHHLPRLASHDVAGLARLLGRSGHVVAAAVRLIQRLDPRPGWRYGEHDTQYVTPDVIARKIHGEWRVKLNAAVVPRLRVNKLYAKLFERHRDASHGELASHLREAGWMVRNVEQRLDTITAVAQAILKRQRGFLELGALAMRPLALREIADELGVHESTVCRVTHNKFVATPAGVFELKYFFSRALPTRSGSACSGIAIRGVISQLIAHESPSKPLSDGDITRQLNRQGLPVARRTVTKYRQGLKLPVADSRRNVAHQQ